jgi:FKBP-type peptidyl-prolyl cis-trans isomerase 2
MEVAPGLVVTFEYTVRLASGRLLDSTGACGPVSILCGAGQLFPALEERLAGMHPGETREIRIAADEAYGPWREELVRTIPRDRLPPDLALEVDGEYRLRAVDGTSLRFRVLAIGETEVRADFNAPHAGQELRATVTVIAVRPPAPDEERRGRV